MIFVWFYRFHIIWFPGCSLIGWCFKPSQPQRITSGLNPNCSLYPSHSFQESLYHNFFLLKPQLKFYSQFRNAQPEKQYHMLWRLFIFREHSTREPASSRATYFILRAYTGIGASHSYNTGKVFEFVGSQPWAVLVSLLTLMSLHGWVKSTEETSVLTGWGSACSWKPAGDGASTTSGGLWAIQSRKSAHNAASRVLEMPLCNR